MLKGALFAAPILAYHQPGKRFIVDTDASNLGLEEYSSKYKTDMSVS
jgi:hypothetical protein